MALLTAKLNPQDAFSDFDTSQSAQDAALASYKKVNATTATISLKSKTDPLNDWVLTINGRGFPDDLSNPTSAIFASFNKASFARQNAPGNVLFTWDGQGSSISAIDLYNAINSGSSDAVLNLFLGGIDTLQADYLNVNISPVVQLENITLQANARNAIGNAASNAITGNAASNLMDGALGNDTLLGDAGNDTLLGGGGNDLLKGGAGNDQMDGGEDGDRYLISSPSEHSSAEINDSGTGGIDELRFDSATAGQTLTLFAGDLGLERIVIGKGNGSSADSSATTALNIDAALASNGLEIIGNAGANRLVGGGFDDQLNGNGGNDTLNGNGGSDLLIGGAGNDSMNGGNSGDLYLIASSAEHSVAEIKDNGTSGSDEVRFTSLTAGQTLTLFAGDTGLERVVIGTGSGASADSTGAAALNINAAAQTAALAITGNNGANSLTGGAGGDVISGNDGNDTLIGGGGGDALAGGAGADLLRGGLGNDTLDGAAGADIYRFDTVLNAGTNVDRIADFSIDDSDRIQLENTGSGLFTAITATGTLAISAFTVGAAFTATSQRIRYDSASGNLFYDADGSASARASILFATLGTGLSLTNSQFTVT